jgi:dTDP-4-amino-4,6-dideoxygalactose transaminase
MFSDTPTNKPIYVTQPFLPPLDEFIPYLQNIWDSKILSNGGPYHAKLEHNLQEYLNIEHVSLCSNGTFALILALKALSIQGEVITTPFSFVATSHSLLWNHLKPIFVDIEPNNFNIDAAKIESAITPQTSAILAVHCYGHPANTAQIKQIADKHGLKIIYDAAHAFGVKTQEGSIFKHGDLSITSFHATKAFNTFEGGAVFTKSPHTKLYIDKLKNFGFENETTVSTCGLNAKMNEITAAFGLLQLKYISDAIDSRREIDSLYREQLKGVRGLRLPKIDENTTHNYSYFPVIIEPEYHSTRDELYYKLKKYNVHARRYFYPLISTLDMYKNLPSASLENLPVATAIADSVLCLPIYPTLDRSQVEMICSILAATN